MLSSSQDGQGQAAGKQHTTLAQKAEIVAGLAMYISLPVMVFLRRKIGYRFLTPTKLFIMTLLLLVYAVLSGVFAGVPATPTSAPYPGYSNPPAPPASNGGIDIAVWAIILFTLGFMVYGLVQRHIRWRDIKAGVPWHTYSRGISWFIFLPLSDTHVKRFIDPAVCLLAGILILFVFRYLGYYLIFSAVCLFVFEAWDYEQQLNRMLDILDDQVDSEVMSENVEYYSQEQPQQRPLEQTAGIPTGIAPDIEAQIQRRRRRQSTPGIA